MYVLCMVEDISEACYIVIRGIARHVTFTEQIREQSIGGTEQDY